ncbi:MAG: YfiR family protein, partial [Acidobacteriota bacterium]
MCGSRPLRFGSISGAAIAALLLLPNLLAAQEVTEPALKAAFIYNFAKFTEWPSNVMPAAEPFIMCVSGDAPVADALEGAIRGRLLDGHKIIVVREPPIGDRRRP